jgi:hypothetical protein
MRHIHETDDASNFKGNSFYLRDWITEPTAFKLHVNPESRSSEVPSIINEVFRCQLATRLRQLTPDMQYSHGGLFEDAASRIERHSPCGSTQSHSSESFESRSAPVLA